MTLLPQSLRLSACSLFLTALWLWAGVPTVAQSEEQTVTEAPARAYGQIGSQIFSTNCAPCHGDAGAGDGPVLEGTDANMIDFRDPAMLGQGNFPVLWKSVTAEGRIDVLMPPWKNQLTDDQMWDAVAYLWQLSTSAEELTTGAEVWNSLESTLDPHQAGQAALGLPLAEWRTQPPAGIETVALLNLSDENLTAVYRYLQALVLSPSWEPLLREGQGIIPVRALPLSPGQTLPSNLPILLKAYVEKLPAGEWTVEAESGGLATFQGLDTSPRVTYRAEVESDGMTFQSTPVSLAAGTGNKELEVDVFAVSDTRGAATIAKLQILLALSENSILLGQQALAANSLPFVFTGRKFEGQSAPVTLEIPLFPGATEVTLAEEEGSRFVFEEDKVLDAAPLFPLPRGTWSTLGYELPLPAQGDTWTQTWVYPVSNIRVLVPQLQGFRIALAGFEVTGLREIEGVAHDLWSADSLSNGQLTMEFLVVPTANVETLTSVVQMPPWMPWGLAGFLLLLVAIFATVEHRRRVNRPIPSKP